LAGRLAIHSRYDLSYFTGFIPVIDFDNLADIERNYEHDLR
jgi:hypothetical protein